MLSCPELVAEKRVLEIGAGYHGIPSMAAVLAEAHTVVATDVDPAALHQLRLNLADVMKGRGIDAKVGPVGRSGVLHFSFSCGGFRRLRSLGLGWLGTRSLRALGNFGLWVGTSLSQASVRRSPCYDWIGVLCPPPLHPSRPKPPRV